MNSQSKVLNLNSELQHFNIPLEQSNNLKNLKKTENLGIVIIAILFATECTVGVIKQWYMKT